MTALARVVWYAVAVACCAHLAEAQESGVQRGVSVQPESVTVGDPFRVVIRVRAPRGSVLEFPESPDTTFKVEPLDRVAVTPSADTSVVEQSAVYRLAAWDVGRRPLRFPDVLVRSGDQVQRVAFGSDLAVTVVSVLPADSAERVPRPPRPVYEFGIPWWVWVVVALVAAALAGLFWWWWRRRKAPPPRIVDPYADALLAFDRVEALGLAAAGEGGQHVALMVDVMRLYLSRVVPVATISRTSTELVSACRSEPRVPLTRLQKLLHDADLVKFARHRATPSRATELADECRAVVAAVHQAAQPVPEARAA